MVAVLLVTAGTAGAFGQPGTEQVSVDTDSTRLNVALQEDGDAQWEVVYRIRLDDENDTQAFDELRQDIQNDSTPYTDRFGQRMERIAATAENTTGREMAIQNMSVETRTQPNYGLLVYEFSWANFAAVDDNTIRAGDAIDQFYLDAQTTLEIQWPSGYVSDSVTPAATTAGENSVVWQGERDFDAGQPRVVVVPQGETPIPPDDGSNGPASDGESGGDLPLVALLAIAALVLGGAVWLYSRRDDDMATADGTDSSDAGDAGSAAAAGDTATDDSPPMDLLSNEEQVLRLLEENGGRIKQKQVAAELDWTAAKTSQVVSGLRDDDELESFRLGRENVLTLPDVDLESDSGDEA
ncbi:DUF7345 domain-containing protein [Salinibaculum rarum]|uniref:DUF7345 domain-containing protein n=1 Tax=Salinibaculum rarum TaxID=3058903 RepID=UPI00265ED916|nr:DUF4897 domain-containing protein [Salinibaculum sp. KK48]